MGLTVRTAVLVRGYGIVKSASGQPFFRRGRTSRSYLACFERLPTHHPGALAQLRAIHSAALTACPDGSLQVAAEH
jgi:hypothetical protein